MVSVESLLQASDFLKSISHNGGEANEALEKTLQWVKKHQVTSHNPRERAQTVRSGWGFFYKKGKQLSSASKTLFRQCERRNAIVAHGCHDDKDLIKEFIDKTCKLAPPTLNNAAIIQAMYVLLDWDYDRVDGREIEAFHFNGRMLQDRAFKLVNKKGMQAFTDGQFTAFKVPIGPVERNAFAIFSHVRRFSRKKDSKGKKRRKYKTSVDEILSDDYPDRREASSGHGKFYDLPKGQEVKIPKVDLKSKADMNALIGLLGLQENDGIYKDSETFRMDFILQEISLQIDDRGVECKIMTVGGQECGMLGDDDGYYIDSNFMFCLNVDGVEIVKAWIEEPRK